MILTICCVFHRVRCLGYNECKAYLHWDNVETSSQPIFGCSIRLHSENPSWCWICHNWRWLLLISQLIATEVTMPFHAHHVEHVKCHLSHNSICLCWDLASLHPVSICWHDCIAISALHFKLQVSCNITILCMPTFMQPSALTSVVHCRGFEGMPPRTWLGCHQGWRRSTPTARLWIPSITMAPTNWQMACVRAIYIDGLHQEPSSYSHASQAESNFSLACWTTRSTMKFEHCR